MPRWGTPSPDQLARGRVALADWVARHGGRSTWEALPPLATPVEVKWSSTARIWRPPLPASDRPATLTVHFVLDKARVDFHDPHHTSWGHDSQTAWVSEDGRRTYPSVIHAQRVVPSLKWYAAMPHKLLDPSTQLQLVEDRLDRVAIRFSTEGGQTGDEMLAEFEDGRLRRLFHTAREFGGAVRAVATFERWQTVAGVLLPELVRVALLSPAPVRDVQTFHFTGWKVVQPPSRFFEIPSEAGG
jgi:hypothetical protein